MQYGVCNLDTNQAFKIISSVAAGWYYDMQCRCVAYSNYFSSSMEGEYGGGVHQLFQILCQCVHQLRPHNTDMSQIQYCIIIHFHLVSRIYGQLQGYSKDFCWRKSQKVYLFWSIWSNELIVSITNPKHKSHTLHILGNNL